MSQFESFFDPLNPQFTTDFSDPAAFLSSLGPKAKTPPSSGGPSGKPNTPKVESPVKTDRDQFKASLQPYIQARLGMAGTPEAVNRVHEWAANRLAGYDARQRLDERAARQRASIIEKAKREKAEREARRSALNASRQYGEQNPAQPTGPSPEAVVDQMNAEYSRRLGARLQNKRDAEERARQQEEKRRAESYAETDRQIAANRAEAASRAYGEANPAKPQGMTSAEQLAQTRADYDAEAAKAKRIRDDATLERVKKRFADQAASYSVVPNTTPLPLPVNPATDKYNRDQAEMARVQEEMFGRILGPVRGVLDKALDVKQQQDVKNLLQSTPTGRLSSLAEPPTITGSQVTNPLSAGPTAEQAGGFAPGFNPNLVKSAVDDRQSGINAVRAAGYDPAPYELRKQVGERWGDPGYADRGDENSKANIGIDLIERMKTQQGPVVGLGGTQSTLAQPDTSGQVVPGMTPLQLNNLAQALQMADATGDTARRDAILGRMSPEQRAEVERFMRSPSYGEFGAGAAIGDYSVPQVEGAVSQFYGQGAQNFQEGNYGRAALDYLAGTATAMVPGIGYDPLDSQDPFGPLGLGAPRAGAAAVRFGEASLKEAAHLDAAARAAAAQAANPANASRTLRSAAIENAERALQTPSQIRGAATAERMATRDADQAISRLAEPDVPNVDLRTPKADRFARLSPEEKATELMRVYDRLWGDLSARRVTKEQFDTMVANTLKGENGELFRKALDAKYPGAADEALRATAPNPR